MDLESGARVIADALILGGFVKNIHVHTLTLMDEKISSKNQDSSAKSAYIYRLRSKSCLSGDIFSDYSFEEPIEVV